MQHYRLTTCWPPFRPVCFMFASGEGGPRSGLWAVTSQVAKLARLYTADELCTASLNRHKNHRDVLRQLACLTWVTRVPRNVFCCSSHGRKAKPACHYEGTGMNCGTSALQGIFDRSKGSIHVVYCGHEQCLFCSKVMGRSSRPSRFNPIISAAAHPRFN
jgi:hypothetical protein